MAAAHQLALTSHHGAGPQIESEPLTGLGEAAEHYRSRATHIVRDIVSPISVVTPDLVSLGFLLILSGFLPDRPFRIIIQGKKQRLR